MVAPLSYLPLYLQLVSMSKKNCQSVPASETALTKVCSDLVAGVTSFKDELETVKDILPTTAQMSELKDVAWTFPTTNETSQASRQILKLFLDMRKTHPDRLAGDKLQGNIFSKERLDALQEDLDKPTLPELTNFDQIDLIMQILLQSRMTREEEAGFREWTKVMLVIVILPQLLVLLFIAIQFALLKRREHRIRRNTLRMSRERTMMQSLLAEMRGQPYPEERPAAVVAHL